MKKRKKKSFLLLLIGLTAFCVYCSLPNKRIVPDDIQQHKEETQSDDEQYLAIEDMIEAYFKGRPVRDVPKEADFSSFLQGAFARRGKNFEQLAKSYEKVLKTDPENNDIKSSLYTYFMLSGDISKSALYAKQALELDESNNTMAFVVLLTEAIKNKNYKDATQLAEKLSPSHDAFLVPVAKAWISVGQRDLKSAIDSLDSIQAKELKPVQLLMRGMIFDYFGKAKQAAEAYNALMQTAEFKNVRVLMLLQEFENRTHLISDKKTLKETYALIEEESFISKEMMSQNKTGEKIASAEEGMSWALFDLSTLLVHSSQLDAGLCYAQMSHYLNPKSSVIHLYVGEVLEFMELYEQANTLYSKVSPNQNIYLSSKMRTALNLIKLKNFDEAEEIISNLLKSYPNVPLFYMTLGDIHREKSEHEKALENYEKALSFTDKKDKQVAPIYFYQGLCYEAMERSDKSVTYFEKALQLDAQNPLYLNYVGYSWLEQNKNLPEALKLIEKAVARSPNSGAVLDSLGWAYFMMGEYQKAANILERAVSLEAGNAVINSHLGDAYWKLKRYREAKFQWSHAATLKQESSNKLLSELSNKLAHGLQK